MEYTILIVDDSATTRAIIKRTIKVAGLPVKPLEASNGMDALRLLAAEHVDLVLADLHMPEMDGIEMARRVLATENTKSIPIVVVSAEPSAEKLEQLKVEGVRGYLRKPFTPESLRNVVCEMLNLTLAEAVHA